MWALNKDDWPWLLLGLLGAIVAGGATPSEGAFIAHIQVTQQLTRMDQRQRPALFSGLGLFSRCPPTLCFDIGGPNTLEAGGHLLRLHVHEK